MKAWVREFVAPGVKGMAGVTLAGVLVFGPRGGAEAATNVIGLNFGADYKAMEAADVAGVVVASTNWNNIAGTNGVSTALHYADGRDAGLTVTRSNFDGAYSARPDGLAVNGDERLMWGYADNRTGLGDGTATVNVSGLTAERYDVYAYFASDGDNRRGTVGIDGHPTYSYRTWARNRSFPSMYLQTTDTGTNYPLSQYAVWTNLTGASFTFTIRSVIDFSSGLNGLQIVERTAGGGGSGDAPVVNNSGGATGITSEAAWLNGMLVSTGSSATAVWVYWGTNDQQESTAGWSGGSVYLGANVSTGALTASVSGLAPGVAYYYRFLATNAAGASWASPAAAFSALGAPVIVNGMASGVSSTNAWLSGELVSPGGAPATVWIYYDRQGTTWPSATGVNLGVLGPGGFSNLVTGLRPNSTYYFRCYATNTAGYEAWASGMQSFTTAPLPTAVQYLGLNFGADVKAMDPTNAAGAVVVFTNWNNVAGPGGSSSGFVHADGSASGITVTRTGFEATYSARPDGIAINGDQLMMWGYADNTLTSNPPTATVTISGLTATTFDVYAYFGSDGNNRRGTIGVSGGSTFSYQTGSRNGNFPAIYSRTTDTGTGYPQHTYAAWTNLSGPELTLTLTTVDFSSGLNGIQLVLNNTTILPGAPLVEVVAASQILSRSALANGLLTTTGSTATAVTLYWGTADAGSTTAGWTGGSIDLGTITDTVPPALALAVPLSGLMPEVTYYYRFVASNEAQETWSGAASFTTTADLTAYAHRMPITFAGYTRAETLVDFPALIVISNGVGGSGFAYSQLASPLGYDLRFAASNGTSILNHEVEAWNTNGTSSIWVQVPALVDTNSHIWAYWGYAPAASAPAPWTTNGAVWNTTHEGVWHFAESGGTLADSTAQGRHGTNNGTTAVGGIVAGARNFNGTSSTIALSGNLAGVLGGGPATFAFWIKTSSTINNGTSFNGSAFLGDDVPDATDTWWGMTEGGVVGLKVGNRDAVMSTASITDDRWRLVTLTRDPNDGNLQVFLDDALDKAELSDPGVRSGNFLNTFGRNPDGIGGGYVVGAFDEIRVRSSVSSADWVWATYMSAASNAVFTAYNFRPEAPLPQGLMLNVY